MPLAILLLSGGHGRAHYAFMLAAAAAAIDRPVTVFAANAGCHALCLDWSGLDGAGDDDRVRAAGVAGLAELRDAATELGATLLACDSGLRLAGIDPSRLLPGVAVSGLSAFLSASACGQLVSL